MKPSMLARATVISILVLAGVAAPVGPATAAPCPWGTQCNAVTMVTPKANDVVSGSATLEARAQQTTPARGDIHKVEWWLYHPSFQEQTPQNAEGKILLFEATAPTSGTRLDGTWRGSWTVTNRMTTRDGAYDLPGIRTYDLPNDGRQYSIEAHALDDEWVRTWGGPSGRTAPVNVTINLTGGTPPPPPAPTNGQVQVGAGSYLLTGTDIYRSADTLVRYNRSATQTVSPANQWGTEAAVVDGRVAEVRVRNSGSAAMAIPTGGFVLSGHGQAQEFLNTHAKIGALVTLPGQTPPPPPSPSAPPTPAPSTAPTPAPSPSPSASSSPTPTAVPSPVPSATPSPEPAQPSSVTIAGSSHPLAGLNIFRSAGTLIRYTRTGSQVASPANQWGVEATVVDGTVTEMHRGAPASPIPATPGAYVLSGHDAAADWLFTNAKVGSTVTLGGSTPVPPTPVPPNPAPGCDAPKWQGSYYPNATLTGTPSLARCDAAVDFSWPGTQGPVAAFEGANFSARWVSRPTFTAGEYSFTVTGDDGIRVRLDGTVIVDQWKDQAASTFTVKLPVTAGPHTLEVEYYEKYGDAFAKFSYDRATGTTPTIGPGQWQVVPVDMPIRALHGTLLRDGRVLLIAGSGNDPNAFAAGTFKSVVWNPATNGFLSVATPKDMFCSGHVTLPDGRVLVAGGTTAYPGVGGEAAYLGGKFAYVFDPATNAFTRTNDMMEGHWYPTLTKIENGNVWAAGGYSERGDGASWNTEMFEASRGAWLTEAEVPQSGQNWGTYPHMFLLGDGRMFYTGGHTFGASKWNASTGAQIYDWRSKAVGDVFGLRDKELRDQAGSVLLPPAQNQTFMIVGGGSTDNGGTTNKADVVNMNDAVPQYRPTADLPGVGRQYLNLTTLPDRTVLASNGGTTPRGGNVLDAAIYRPTAGTWTPVAADPVGRNYHAAALLLPDGRVAVFGSNPADNSFEMRISIYSPAYLDAGVSRPTVASVSTGAEATYGESFDLGVTGDVVAASLISPGSSTHQTDTNARLVDLPITGSGATRRATVPTNPALLPPGPYMLTVVSSGGIPSVARWINVR